MSRRERRKEAAHQRKSKALMKQWEEKGCPRCYTLPVGSYLHVRNAQGVELFICEPCMEYGDTALGVGVWFKDNTLSDDGTIADRQWFEAHPDADHYHREPFPGETCMLREVQRAFIEEPTDACLPANRIYVHQYRPGVRRRVPFWLKPTANAEELAQKIAGLHAEQSSLLLDQHFGGSLAVAAAASAANRHRRIID